MKNKELIGTIDNTVPTEEEIEKVVTDLKNDGKPIPGMFKYGLIANDDSVTKSYLLLLKNYDDDEEERDWQIVTGRQDAYEYLRRLIEAEAIIPDESYVLSGTTPFEEAITVYRFMRVMLDRNLVVEETGFDIEDYHSESYYPEDKKIIEES